MFTLSRVALPYRAAERQQTVATGVSPWVSGVSNVQRRRRGRFRMSLGANQPAVIRMILKQAMRPVAVGVIFGLALSALASRVLSSLLFGISPLDPVIFSGISLFLVTVLCLPVIRPLFVQPGSIH
jgi:hypothetical protein